MQGGEAVFVEKFMDGINIFQLVEESLEHANLTALGSNVKDVFPVTILVSERNVVVEQKVEALLLPAGRLKSKQKCKQTQKCKQMPLYRLEQSRPPPTIHGFEAAAVDDQKLDGGDVAAGDCEHQGRLTSRIPRIQHGAVLRVLEEGGDHLLVAVHGGVVNGGPLIVGRVVQAHHRPPLDQDLHELLVPVGGRMVKRGSTLRVEDVGVAHARQQDDKSLIVAFRGRQMQGLSDGLTPDPEQLRGARLEDVHDGEGVAGSRGIMQRILALKSSHF